MIMAASVYATPPPDLSGEEAALSDASNSSQTNSSHGSTLKASKRTLSSSFLNATTANTTQSSTITTTSSSQQSSDSLPDLSKKRRKQSMPIRFATNGTVIEPSSVPGGETEAVAGRLAESGARSEPLGQSERDRRTPNDADDDEEDDGCQSPNAPSPAMETDQEPDSDGAALLEQQQNNFQKIFLSNLSQLQQKHLQLQQQQQQHAAGESGLGSPGTASLPDSFLASKLTSLISLSTGRGMTKSDDEQEPDEPEHRPSVDMVGSNPRSFNSKEHYNGSVESEELKAYHEESLRAGSENHGSIGHGDRSSNHSPSPMMSNPPKLSLKKELMFDPEWDGEIRSNLPKPEDWMSIAGLSFPFPPEAAAALSASGYLPQLPLLGVPTVSPFGGGAGSTDGTNRPSVPPLRIFNPEAYCDLCNKEFCNKYFLKTHKANKHGIYEPAANSSNNPSDNNPPAFSALMNPFNPIHQLSQLPDGFREDYMVEQEDTSFTPQPRKLSPHSMQAAKDANFSADKLKRLGVINTEAFCEICCKEYCNKYFLRTHKLKRHGILPTADELKEERNLPPWVPFMQTSPLNLIMGGSAATAADMVSAQMALQASSPSSLKKFMVAAAAASAAGELAANGADTNLGTIDGSNGGSSVSPLEIKQELQGKGRGMSNGDGPDMQGSSSDAGAGGDGDDRNSTGPAGQKDIGSDEDAEAISVDLQKLQSMIMQLNDLNNQHQRKMGCGVCGKELANQYLLHAHMIQEHGPLGENNNGGLKGSREPTPLASITSTGTPVGPGTGDTMEVCKQCDKEFSNEFLLKQHLIEVHGLPSIPSPKREGFITPERRTTGGNSGGGTTGSTTAGTASGPPPAPNYNDRKPTFSMTPTSSYCEICNKELCNKYFMKTHMQRMHGIEIENGAQIGGVVCNICNKELCSKYFLRVHKHNTHGIVEEGAPLPQARQNGGAAASSGAAGAGAGAGGATGASGVTGDSPMMGTGGPDHSNDGTDPSGLLKPGEITDTSNRYYSHFTEVCPLCSRRFRSAKWLRAHLLSDHGKPGVDKLKELEQKLANGPGSVGQTGASNGGGRSKSNSPSLKVPNGSGGAGGMVEPKFNPKSPFGAISPAEAAKFLPKGAGIPGLFGTEQTPSPMGGMKGYQCSFCTFATPLLPLLFIHERSHSSLTIVQQQLLQQQQQQHHQQQQQQQQQQSDEGLGSPMGEATFPSLLKSESAVSLAKEHSAHHQTLPGTNSSSVGSSSETPSSTPASTPVPSLSQEALHLQQQHQQQRSRSGSRYELRQSPDPESTSRMTELRHLKTSSPKMASAPSPATGGGGEPNAMLTEMANITQRPAIYALPQQSGPLMMQSFLIEESASSPSFGAAGNRSPKDALAGLTGQQDHRFVPAVVFLPVKERILTPMTISFNLSPA
uniref:C2H2-type domain-containing protein n=1 Tax=Anopheles albimanus TaxID=7167 RepID=A0A182FQU5_ANOAL